ncbi:hypothetical protein [Plantactinospora soyae]|uniref:Uncharacterized protein n=1 Tax=Plantactinospora soyae TaxID=1544732 RepID=A0A927M590_9ACTN|nr:hypothetical protein [Plantactinospora soyae]MBE1485708.1 hypothetical protein [Plantactinospora soyae]
MLTDLGKSHFTLRRQPHPPCRGVLADGNAQSGGSVPYDAKGQPQEIYFWGWSGD